MAIALSSGATNFTATITASPTATRTVTVPDSDFTMTGNDLTQTLTNKTLTSPTLTNELATTIRETITISATAATGTINFDASTQVVLYYTTNASGNWTLNIRGDGTTTLNSLMANNSAITIVFMVTQGTPAYYSTALTIDGVSVTPKWQGGTAPAGGNANSVDVYTYSILKTASATYTVIASQVRFA